MHGLLSLPGRNGEVGAAAKATVVQETAGALGRVAYHSAGPNTAHQPAPKIDRRSARPIRAKTGQRALIWSINVVLKAALNCMTR